MLAKVHFPCKTLLREEMTELVRWNINRDSMEDKQRALVELMPALKRDIKHQVCILLCQNYNTILFLD